MLNLHGVRVYDNGGPDKAGGSVDRYTVCYPAFYFAGDRKGRTYIYPVVTMSGSPYWPQGICMHGEYTHPIDRPRHAHLGKRIRFEDLPPDCQKVVMDDLRR
jgi:hypothetical protein